MPRDRTNPNRMPLVDRNVRLAVDGRVILLVHGRDGTLSAILSQRDEDLVDVVEIDMATLPIGSRTPGRRRPIRFPIPCSAVRSE